MTTKSDQAQSASACFDHALNHARKRPTSPDCPRPQPSSGWPDENITLLEQYRTWLIGGGTGSEMVETIYVPTAGSALGLNTQPYPEWNLETEFERTRAYIYARGLSAISTNISTNIRRNALEKFRQFLRQLRGQHEVAFQPIDYERYCMGLPDWLVEQLKHYQHIRQVNWRPARIHYQAMRFWGSYTNIWRWLFAHYPIQEIVDIKRQYILDYVDHRLTTNYAAKSINQELRNFRACLLFLQDQDFRVPLALMRLPHLKEPETLPRFLTDAQVRRLRDDLEQRVVQAAFVHQRRDALLDRAAFYLLWQGGMRLGEVEELRMDDLGLAERKLMVRQGKGRKDRAVYLTDMLVQALQTYLAVRGPGPTDHVFFYRHRPVSKDLIRARIKASGVRVGVAVSPHRLRHTCATQLLNAGCRVTSIQKFLGHKRIDTTMIYAQVHDQSVSDDYYAAMSRIEIRLDTSALLSPSRCCPSGSTGLAAESDTTSTSTDITLAERTQLLDIASRLSEPNLGTELRLNLAEKMRAVLAGTTPAPCAT